LAVVIRPARVVGRRSRRSRRRVRRGLVTVLDDPLMWVHERLIEYPDDVVFHYFDKAARIWERAREYEEKAKAARDPRERRKLEQKAKQLKKQAIGKLQGAFGDISFIVKPRKGGRSMGVHHIVFGKSGELKHYGIKGIRGWHGDPSKEDMLFYNVRGFHVEYDIFKDIFYEKRRRNK